MMKRRMILVGVFLVFLSVLTVSAQTLSIDAPKYGVVDETLSVTVTSDGDVVEGADVYFVLNDPSIPVHINTTESGVAVYKPLLAGTLRITAKYDGLTAEKMIPVYDGEPINITAFSVDSTASRGSTFDASVTIRNEASFSINLTVLVSGGHDVTGYPIAGTGIVTNLDAGQETTLPMLVYVPASADMGDYTLHADAWIDENYPNLMKAVSSTDSVTTTVTS